MENPRFAEMKLWFLGTFRIIQSAMKIPFRNPNFIALTLITSFPLFCMTLIPRMPYEQPALIMEVTYQLRVLSYHSNPLISDMSWAIDQAIQLLQVNLVDLLNFLLALTTIYAASTIYISSDRSKMNLRDLLRNSITKTRWCGPFFTFIFMSLMYSLCSNVVYYWHHASRLLPSSCTNRVSQAITVIVPVVALAKWLDLSAWWNLSVVVSILEEAEENRAFEGLLASAKLTKGNRTRGFTVMLLYYVWSSQLPTLIARWTFPSVIAFEFLDTCFLCLGKVMTWVFLTVYYYDCKNRHKRLP